MAPRLRATGESNRGVSAPPQGRTDACASDAAAPDPRRTTRLRTPSRWAGILVAFLLLAELAAVAAPVPGTPNPAATAAVHPLFPPPFLAPSVSSGSSVFYVGAQAPTMLCNPLCTRVTNAGARTTIQVVSQTAVGCLSYWIGDDSAANLWAQVGYYICNGSTPVAFYQIWNLTAGTALTTGTTAVSTGTHTFSESSQSGGSTWAFAVDGVVFGTYDLGAGLSLGTYPVQAVSEEGLVSGPWVPAQVTFPTAMETYQTTSTNPVGSGWTPVTSAFEPWSGCTSGGAVNSTGGYTCWGIAGNLQDATVAPNALVIGGSQAAIPAGTNLWNGVASDFSLAASPTSVATTAGASVSSTITVSAVGSFTGTVALSAAVSPATGLGCSLTPTSVSGGAGTSSLSCAGSAGTYTVTVTGTSGSLSHSASVTVAVTDFSVSAVPTSVSFVAGASGTSTVSVSGINGFSGTVTLSASVSPATGLSCSLSPTSVSASGTSTLTCVGSTAATFTVTVTGTSGPLSHSVAVTVTVTAGPTLTLSYAIVGGAAGSTAPTLTYVQGGATKTATLTTSATAYTVDVDSAWSVTNPLGGSSASERWQTAQATSGTAAASVTIVFSYDHQVAVTFAYSVTGGGTGYSAPTVSYTSFGSAASTATGASVWADAGSAYGYPAALGGSSLSEAWRTSSPSGTITAATSIAVTYFHQFSVTFGYAVSGGGSGYAAPSIATAQFGLAVSVAPATATWVDAGASYAFSNPLGGSTTTERWVSISATGVVSTAGTIAATYIHQFSVTFAFTVQGGGSGYAAPTATYQSLGAGASTAMGSAVWADAGSTYVLTNPLTGSGSTERWQSPAATGTLSAAGTLSTVYDHQFFVSFVVQVLNGGSSPSGAVLSCTSLGAAASIPANGSGWIDAGTAYAYPASFAGATGERWVSVSPANGTVTQSMTITASYEHQYAVGFAYAVVGGGTGSSAPTIAYVAVGLRQSTVAGTTVWADAGSAFAYAPTLPGSSSTNQWVALSTGGIVASAGTVTVTYVHQAWVDFTYLVKGGGSGYSAPNVAYSNLSSTTNVLAVNLWVWADFGAAYQYQNPLPGSTSTNSWQTNNGVGTVGSSTTVSATYRHQYKVRFKTTTATGVSTPETPMVNVTVFGTNVSLPADNVTWVDAGTSYGFPSLFYGPLPGERWITYAPPSGLVLGPLNITAAYALQYYLFLQVNAPSGGTVSGTAGWYNATASLILAARANPGWQFQGWIGSGTGSYTGPQGTATIAMDTAVSETAVFYVGLTLTASNGGSLEYAYAGTRGWVPAGATQTLYMAPGTNVTVQAVSALFYQLDGWGGSGSGSAPTVVLAADQPQTLSATFGLSLYSKADSLLGLALVTAAILGLAASVRRHRRKKKERALRIARIRTHTRA